MPMIDGKQLRDGSIALVKMIASDITTMLAPYFKKDGSVAMTGTLQLNTNPITGVTSVTMANSGSSIVMAGGLVTGLGAPTAPDHAARLQDIQNIPWKEKCQWATTGNHSLSGLATTNMDGTAPTAGDRVLAWKQTTPAQNGIYIAASGAWSRAVDADSPQELRAAVVTIEKGTLYADHRFAQTADAINTIGTDTVTFVDIGVGTPAAYPVNTNKAMTASVTTGVNQLACATTIAKQPAQGSYVEVHLNGQQLSVCDGPSDSTKEVYFAPTAGIANARAIANIQQGDALYWNISTYNLAATDVFDFNFQS